MSYNSKYKGSEVEALLDKVKTLVVPDTSGLATKEELSGKQDTISDLATIRSGASKGATALQSYTETDPVFSASAAAGIKSSDITNWNSKTSNTGTITGITMNGASKGTSGVVDLGTVITSHQDISGKADKSSLATVATSGSYNDLSNKPTIPSAVTESTVSGWGFTKNTGTYSKPSTGIPKSDLASAVQTSLGKADTALQSYTEQYKGTVTGVKVNGTTKNPSSGVVDIGNVVTSIKINGSTKTPSNGVVDLGTIEGGNSGAEVIIYNGASSSISVSGTNKLYIVQAQPGVSYNVTISSNNDGDTTRLIFINTIAGMAYGSISFTTVSWANESTPDFSKGGVIEMSFTRVSGNGVEYLGVWSHYKELYYESERPDN